MGVVRVDRTFHMSERRLPDGLILDLKGDLTREAEGPLLHDDHWQEVLMKPGLCLVLNFTEVSYINSAGIACLIRLTRAVASRSCHTFAYGLTPHYQKLFRMVGLTEYLMIYPDEISVLGRIEALSD